MREGKGLDRAPGSSGPQPEGLGWRGTGTGGETADRTDGRDDGDVRGLQRALGLPAGALRAPGPVVPLPEGPWGPAALGALWGHKGPRELGSRDPCSRGLGLICILHREQDQRNITTTRGPGPLNEKAGETGLHNPSPQYLECGTKFSSNWLSVRA